MIANAGNNVIILLERAIADFNYPAIRFEVKSSESLFFSAIPLFLIIMKH